MQSKILTKKKINQLLKSGKWMIRFDNDGEGYGGFKWNPLGEWTEAPDWNTKAECSGGLFGQSPDCNGFCTSRTDMVLCEIDTIIEVEGNKIKTNKALRLATNKDIPAVFLNGFSGNLDLWAYKHRLPKGFTHFGGYLYLWDYKHKLPKGFTHCGGNLSLGGYKHQLPAGFTYCGGDLRLWDYNHNLPMGFTHCGGDLFLSDYKYKLPKGFTHCGGDLFLNDHTNKLPAGFTHCGGDLFINNYKHKLPAGFTYCGGDLFINDYIHKLPDGFIENGHKTMKQGHKED